MSETPESVAELSPEQELAALLDETRRHLMWLSDAGVRQLRREETPSEAAQPTATSAPTGPGGRPRPSFMTQPPPVRPPPVVPPVAPPVTPIAPVGTAPTPPLTIVPTAIPMAPPGVPMTAPTVAAVPPVDRATRLALVQTELGDCRRCRLCETRQKIVFGEGSPQAEVLFLGEGPGADEDASGRPFVGRAGQLLDKMIVAMGLSRPEVYICNIVKCRPPENRRPEPDEVAACRPFFEQQVRAVQPKVIVTLGLTASQSLLRTTTGISDLRNNWQSYEGIPVMPTYHPAYLLRAPAQKAAAWADLKKVLERLGRPVPSQRGGA